jgi:hypothetical protein
LASVAGLAPLPVRPAINPIATMAINQRRVLTSGLPGRVRAPAPDTAYDAAPAASAIRSGLGPAA